MTKAHLFNLCNGEKNGKINEKLTKMRLELGFQPHVSLFSVSATNFHFGASLVLNLMFHFSFTRTEQKISPPVCK